MAALHDGGGLGCTDDSGGAQSRATNFLCIGFIYHSIECKVRRREEKLLYSQREHMK